ncbi:hypothetical protein ACQCSX_12680 [Pseudarthrobacter sp. P1]|uniref:hypothetical protein n=1 Tax=Pseudarthrobacter sp. P1 TaxID=3418418 RepID=UPI003CF86FF4
MRRRTRRGDLAIPSRGLRVPWNDDQDDVERIRPIVRITPGGVASHTTAATVWGMPLPGRIQQDLSVHITRPTHADPPKRTGVAGHHCRLEPGEVRTVRGLDVTSPVRTWLDLAPMLTLDELVAVGDFIVCEHHRSFGPGREPLATLEELKAAVSREHRRRGLVRAREAVELVRVGVDSPPETQVRLIMLRAAFPEPVLNYVVVDGAFNEMSWPDLAVPEWKVAIEYDGGHHLTARQKEIDDDRDHRMAQLGWRQVRISKGLLRDYGERAVVRRISEALRAQGWRR